jgi:hypothetical protein
VRESLGLEVPYLILYAFILLVVTGIVFFGTFIFCSLIKYACVVSGLY